MHSESIQRAREQSDLSYPYRRSLKYFVLFLARVRRFNLLNRSVSQIMVFRLKVEEVYILSLQKAFYQNVFVGSFLIKYSFKQDFRQNDVTQYLAEESHLPEGRGRCKEEECERNLDDEGGQHAQPVHPLWLKIGSVP